MTVRPKIKRPDSKLARELERRLAVSEAALHSVTLDRDLWEARAGTVRIVAGVARDCAQQAVVLGDALRAVLAVADRVGGWLPQEDMATLREAKLLLEDT